MQKTLYHAKQGTISCIFQALQNIHQTITSPSHLCNHIHFLPDTFSWNGPPGPVVKNTDS